MGSAKDIAILSDILSATAADGGAAGDGDLSLLEVLQAYEQVLPEHGLSVHEDSYYYRVLLQWSLNASTRSGWRQCLQAAYGSVIVHTYSGLSATGISLLFVVLLMATERKDREGRHDHPLHLR